MKLIVQIPCLNEEANVGATIRDIPRDRPGRRRTGRLLNERSNPHIF
ncbi:MAG: hypothetical protein P9M08_09010 [Candidatus Erginobacter occultus]|nr:hypothetical protein [Candidatus Erginobacter occultus]